MVAMTRFLVALREHTHITIGSRHLAQNTQYYNQHTIIICINDRSDEMLL